MYIDIPTEEKVIIGKLIEFKRKLEKNITLFDTYSEEEVNEVIDICQLDSFYRDYKLTIIDEHTVSGDQAQRIALARLLLRKPKLLCLDEPTSALDDYTADKLVIKLKEYCEKYHMILFVISHKNDMEVLNGEVITL